jgi:pimeloyl-ACP methyl ester carboxylesterase
MKTFSKTLLFKAARMFFAVIFGFALLVAVFLRYIQDRLIYHPSTYGAQLSLILPKGGQALNYETSCGRQTAFYLPPKVSHSAPSRLWVMFHGNASLALDYLDILEKTPDPEAGFLLIDYPGYAACEGHPSPASILESSEKALGALDAKLKIDPKQVKELDVFGYSLGAASALQLAARYPVHRLVLIAPFTSLFDMARRVVGWPLCYLLRDRFDNRARLAELARRPDRPQVDVFHGTADTLIPISMSREMAARVPGWIKLHEVAGADHISVLWGAERQIQQALAPR